MLIQQNIIHYLIMFGGMFQVMILKMELLKLIDMTTINLHIWHLSYRTIYLSTIFKNRFFFLFDLNFNI